MGLPVVRTDKRGTSYVGVDAGERRTPSPRTRNDPGPTAGPVPVITVLVGQRDRESPLGPVSPSEGPGSVALIFRVVSGTAVCLGPLCRGPPGRVSEEDFGSLDRGNQPRRPVAGPGTSAVVRVKDGVRGCHAGFET